MKASDNPYPSILIEEATDPDAPAAGHQRLFIDSADQKLKAIDSSSGLTVFGQGIADEGAFTFFDATEAAAPATPASGYVRIYAKTDGRIYSKDDAGTEYGPFDEAGSGSSGPLLNVDSITLDAAGDEFTTTALTGWTLVGIDTGSEVTAVTTEPYDSTCLDVVFASQGDRLYKAIDSGDWVYYLTIHGITNSTPSSDAALDAMIALVATDDAGTGTGISLYGNPDGYFLWAVASHIYSSSAASGNLAFQTSRPARADNWPIAYRLSKSGTTIEGGVSFDGGSTWRTLSRTDSTTFTRICVTRLFNSGGTTPTLRLGRFNLVP